MNAQEKELLQHLKKNRSIQKILDKAGELQAPNWYLGAGGVSQTVWNIKHGFPPENGIKDYDLVYYDPKDISSEAQDDVIERGNKLFKDIPIPVEIVNEARVHLWYKKEFGYQTNQNQYKSCEEAISVWPTTATAVGVRKETTGEFTIYTPFGLNDLLDMIVRPNKPAITQKVYEDKANRWKKTWPKLEVIPW